VPLPADRLDRGATARRFWLLLRGVRGVDAGRGDLAVYDIVLRVAVPIRRGRRRYLSAIPLVVAALLSHRP